MLAFRTGWNQKIAFCVSGPIILWLLTCTFVSMPYLYLINVAPLAIFGLLGFIYSVNIGRLKCENLGPLLAFVTTANVALSISMLLSESVAAFMIAHYSNYYSDLVSSMIGAYKPVTVFSTHSLAGTFAYFFFFLNFRTYRKNGKSVYLWLAILQVLMCIALMSTTSLAFAALAVAELIYTFKWRAVVFLSAAVFLIPSGIKESLGYLLMHAGPGEGNGFAARYGINGDLHNSLAYILSHPLLPTGLNYSPNVMIGDSGPVEYMLLGSVPLVLLIYVGLLWFLRRNLVDKWDCYHFFAVILAAEIGFTTLTYIRSFLLIPAFVIYLNSLSDRASSPVNASLLPSLRSGNAYRHYESSYG